MTRLLFLFSFFFLFSCTKEEHLYTSQDIVSFMKEGDPKAGFRLADYLAYDELITKEEVPSKGLFRFHYLKAKNIGFIGLEYKTHRQAKKAAKKIKGVYVHNWAFDEVANEPVLKKFLAKYLKTKEAK